MRLDFEHGKPSSLGFQSPLSNEIANCALKGKFYIFSWVVLLNILPNLQPPNLVAEHPLTRCECINV